MMMGKFQDYLPLVQDRLGTTSVDSGYEVSKIYRAMLEVVEDEILQMDLEIFLQEYSLTVVDGVAEFPADLLRFVIFDTADSAGETELRHLSQKEFSTTTGDVPRFCVKNIGGVLKLMFAGIGGELELKGVSKVAVADRIEDTIVPLPNIFRKLLVLMTARRVLKDAKQWEDASVFEREIETEKTKVFAEAFRLGEGSFGYVLDREISYIL